jgi:hypothetical protein
MLNMHSISHPRLKNNKFPIGFNVADLSDQLDSVEVKVRAGKIKLGMLDEAR